MADASVVPVTREWEGEHCGYAQEQNLVIETKEQWREVWKKAHNLRIPSPDLPDVDFEREMVIAVFRGDQPTSGYAVRIVNIAKIGKEIVVEVERIQPGPETIEAATLTQPYHIVVIKKYSLPVRFQDK